MKKKRETVKGRTAAVIGMVLLIVCSIPIGMGLSLVRERNKVTEQYYGSYGTFGLLEDLSYCSGYAADMVTLGGKYLPADDGRMQALRTVYGALEAAQSPGEKADAYAEMTVCMGAMYQTLCETEMSAEDEKYCEEIYANYNTNVDLIGYNDYNIRAAEFNETLHNAPGRVIAEWMGVKELELFA